MRKRSKGSSSIVEEKERRFQEIYKDWKEQGLHNNEMWELVMDCCKNIALYIVKVNGLYGPRVENIEERWMDAAIDVIRRMKVAGVHPENLKKYASSWVTYHLQHNKANIQQDIEYQLNAFLDDNGFENYVEAYTDSFEDELIERICKDDN